MNRAVLVIFSALMILNFSSDFLSAAYTDRGEFAFLDDDFGKKDDNIVQPDKSLTAVQKVMLQKVAEALRESLENRDLADFLTGNFPDDKLMKEASDNLKFGRHNPYLAAEIERRINEE